MGSTAADTQTDIVRLRDDMTATVDEIERRVTGGLKTAARAEAKITSPRMRRELVDQARQKPPLLGGAGALLVAAFGYGVYSAMNRTFERQKPRHRLNRGVRRARAAVGERAGERLGLWRRQLGHVGQRSLLLKLDPKHGGYYRIIDARLEPRADKNRKRNDVIKKLFWAGVLSMFMALGGVIARRAAGGLWQATVREGPPSQKA
jgi:hypothetical protein